jgi:hypothetical protein
VLAKLGDPLHSPEADVLRADGCEPAQVPQTVRRGRFSGKRQGRSSNFIEPLQQREQDRIALAPEIFDYTAAVGASSASFATIGLTARRSRHEASAGPDKGELRIVGRIAEVLDLEPHRILENLKT